MKKRSCLIVAIIICTCITSVIYLYFDAKWQDEQLERISYEFMEALVSLDDEEISQYCNESTTIYGGDDYYTFINDTLPLWKSSQKEIIGYRITGESDRVPGWFFFEIDYCDWEGEKRTVKGSFQISRERKEFFVSMLSL